MRGDRRAARATAPRTSARSRSSRPSSSRPCARCRRSPTSPCRVEGGDACTPTRTSRSSARLYSVPWRLIGQRVWVRGDADDARDLRGRRARGHPSARRRRASAARVDEHLPPSSARPAPSQPELLGGAGRAPGRRRRRATCARSSPATTCSAAAHRAGRSSRHLETFPGRRAPAPPARAARFYGNYTYPACATSCAKALDREPLPGVAVPAPAIRTRAALRPRSSARSSLRTQEEDRDDAH